MSRFAYIWIIAAVASAFWFHAHEEAVRRSDINKATTDALYVGAVAGCKSNNKIVREVIHLADKLHPPQAAEVEKALKTEPCQKRAHRIVVRYNDIAYH